MDIGNSCYIISESGEIARFSPQKVMLTGQLISKLTNSLSFGIPYSVPVADRMMSICLKNNELILGIKLTELRISSFYMIKDDYLYPCFTESGGVTNPIYYDTVKLSTVWVPPPTMELFFVLMMSGDVSKLSQLYISRAYMYARSTSKKQPGMWRLPLSNTHETTELCLGESIKGVQSPNLAQIMGRSLDILNNSLWSNDLLPSRDLFNIQVSLFRFNPVTLEQIPVDKWTDYCVKANNPIIETMNEYL